MERIEALCETLILHVSADSLILIYLILPLQTESLPHERQICILGPFLCRVVYLYGLCSRGKPSCMCRCEVEGPLFPAGIKILQVSNRPGGGCSEWIEAPGSLSLPL